MPSSNSNGSSVDPAALSHLETLTSELCNVQGHDLNIETLTSELCNVQGHVLKIQTLNSVMYKIMS